jgi:hypothetical protein
MIRSFGNLYSVILAAHAKDVSRLATQTARTVTALTLFYEIKHLKQQSVLKGNGEADRKSHRAIRLLQVQNRQSALSIPPTRIRQPRPFPPSHLRIS